MSISILLCYLAIQLIAQYMFYHPIKKWLFKMHSKKITTIPKLKYELSVVNIAASLFILVLTGRGGMTGMTNTFASVFLALIMYIDYNVYYHSILTGSYFKKIENESLYELERKEELKKLEQLYKKMYKSKL